MSAIVTTVRIPEPNPLPAVSDDEGAPLTLVSLLSSLSYALDLTEGLPMGHAVRATLIGLHIGEKLGLPAETLDHLHYTLLLKDAGCSSNAARMYAIFGCDDLTAKRDSKIRDWTRASEGVRYALRHTMPHAPLSRRLRKLAELSCLPERVMDTLTAARCERGADIARSLGMPDEVAEAIYALDEHWDGQGAPHHRQGDAIPLLARIACLAQTLEIFAASFGVEQAYTVVRSRSGTWFDPELLRAAESFARESWFWEAVHADPHALLEEMTRPSLQGRLAETDADKVCDSFSAIVDAKSSFTAAHSSRVQEYADRIAAALGVVPARRQLLRRAALLHDLGKLSVPNAILDKPAALTEAEFAVVRQHPYHTHRILSGIPGFATITEIAAAHHEKLDGSGYYRGMTAETLTLEMRVLTVADIYDALTAARPYRNAIPPDDALAILHREAGRTLDADCVAALAQMI